MDTRQVSTCLIKFQFMVDNLSARYILPHLIQEDIISEEEAQHINSHPAENDKIRAILTTVMSSRKQDVFVSFLRCLNAANWGFVASELWDTYNTAGERLQLPAPQAGDWLNSMGASGMQVVSDDVLVDIVGVITNYKTLAILMGLTPASVIHLEQQHPHLPDRILKMLMMWKKREGREASVVGLVQLCRMGGLDDASLKHITIRSMKSSESLGNAII